MPPPQRIARADVLLAESTCGDRLHPAEDVPARLGAIIRRAVRRGGSVPLPSFVVGRAQALAAGAATSAQQRYPIVFPGFQVAGTRGAKLVEGAREVKIFGEYIAVKAEVSHFEGFSGHADADELLQWLRGFEAEPARTFVIHGEPHATDALRTRVQDELGWNVQVPGQMESVAV